MNTKWRLILDGDRDAVFNMAADDAIFRLCAAGRVPPTLRFYGWSGPAISLGRLQRSLAGKVDMDYCRESGTTLVRRPTGGRAVIHGHDLTFSITLLESEIPSEHRSIVKSHQWLMSGIAAGLRSLGSSAELGPDANRPTPASISADCFAHVAECDIRVGREKVVGAAQARSRGALLEQGSIPLTAPLVDTSRIFPGSKPSTVCHMQAARSEIEQSIVKEFSRTIGLEFEIGSYTEWELELISTLDAGCRVIEL